MKKLFSSLVVVSFSVASIAAYANVNATGTWPADEKNVSLTIDAPRAEAVKKLADVAGWSIVLPEKLGASTEALHVKVTDESPKEVLEGILEPGEYTASRHGKMVVITEATSNSNPTSNTTSNTTSTSTSNTTSTPTSNSNTTPTSNSNPTPTPTPTPESDDLGEDRSVMGGNAIIGKNERVHDVSVMGGNVEIEGTVTGGVSVMGGRARIKDGAHVIGDAVAVGGALDVEKGGRVDGDVGVIGGVLQKHEGSIIRGKVISSGGKITEKEDGDGTPSVPAAARDPHKKRNELRAKLSDAGSSVTRSAMLFVFGVVLLSLLRKRYDVMKVEIAARPMKSFAIGIIALLLAIVATVVLSITVIGIPLVVVGWLFAALCVYGGIVSVLTLAGELVLRHKTQNPYAHLAAGCALFLVLGAVPVLGSIVTALVGFIAVGSVIRTRAGGLFAKET